MTIPANEIVFVSRPAANRDPERFADPHRLDAGRPSNAHLSFGHGIHLHHCVGAPLARLEGEIIFRRLLERFPRWELAVPAEALEWRYTAAARSLERLPVRLG